MKYIILVIALLLAGCEVRIDSDNIHGDDESISQGDQAAIDQSEAAGTELCECNGDDPECLICGGDGLF